MEAFGATPEQIAAAKDLQDEVEIDFEVFSENWEIVQMFLRLSTQWNVGFNGLIGLNYSSVEYLCKLYEVKDQRLLLEGLQVMEMATLSYMNKKK